jgi:hypothetical protein
MAGVLEMETEGSSFLLTPLCESGTFYVIGSSQATSTSMPRQGSANVEVEEARAGRDHAAGATWRGCGWRCRKPCKSQIVVHPFFNHAS